MVDILEDYAILSDKNSVYWYTLYWYYEFNIYTMAILFHLR
jgi:hypothetical protein